MDVNAIQSEIELNELVEQFVSHYRAGGFSSSDEFPKLHPDIAAQLGDLLPTLILLERNLASYSLSDSGNTPLAKRCAVEHSIPRSIGDYAVEREIGRGGMGVIYKALDRKLQRTVALKVLSTARLKDAIDCARFQLEARAASKLHHRHIVPVFSVGEHEGFPFYAMQLIEGQSLEAIIVARRMEVATNGSEHCKPATASTDQTTAPTDDDAIEITASPREMVRSSAASTCRHVAQIALQVTDALAYAHSQGVVHRDIKPSNLILDNHGDVWITDFGLAKLNGADALTKAGDVVGTLRYMAPERLEGWSDRRSDIYGLGATLYELVTLRPLFEASSHSELIHSVLHSAPVVPSKIATRVSRDLETIIVKALSKEPAARYRSAEEMAEDLRRFLADRPILSRRSTSAERLMRWCRRNPVVASLTGTVAALLVTAVVILTVSNLRIQRQSEETLAALEQKNAALGTAGDAVERMLVRIADDKLSGMPRTLPLRNALLRDALAFYNGLLKQSEEAGNVKHAAALLLRVGKIHQELQQYPESLQAYQRATALLKPIVESSPHDIAALQPFAEAQEASAFVQFIAPPLANQTAVDVEEQFQKAIAIYDQIQSLQPARPQPPPACFSYLADLLTRRGATGEALQVWRQSISRGQHFVEQFPENTGAQVSLCWSCAVAADRIMRSPHGNYAEAETLLNQAVEHASAAMEHKIFDFAGITVGRYAAAFVQLQLGRANNRLGKFDNSIAAFQTATRELQVLCTAAPWNLDHWGCLEAAQAELVGALKAADRKNDAIKELHEMAVWLPQTAGRLPDDSSLQSSLQLFAAEVASQLLSLGKEVEARSLAQSMVDLHLQIDARLRSTSTDQVSLAKWQLLYPVELLPQEDFALALTNRIAPALRHLSINPVALSEASKSLVDRIWAMRNARPDMVRKIAEAMLNATPDVPETAAMRLSALKVLMFQQTYYGNSPAEAKSTALAAIKLAHDENLYGHPALTPIYTQLIDVTERLGETEEAIHLGRDAVSRIEKFAIRDVPSAFTYHHLGRVLRSVDPSASIPVLREAWMRLDGENQSKFASEAFGWEMSAALNSQDDEMIQNTCRAALQYLSARYGDNALPVPQLGMRCAANLALGNVDLTLIDFQGVGQSHASRENLLLIAQVMSQNPKPQNDTAVKLVSQLATQLATVAAAKSDMLPKGSIRENSQQ